MKRIRTKIFCQYGKSSDILTQMNEGKETESFTLCLHFFPGIDLFLSLRFLYSIRNFCKSVQLTI